MGYRTLRQCLDDLEAAGHLVRVADEVDAHLEAAEIHRRVFKNGGPAVLFENVKDCSFPMVSNLFGSIDRARYMFRDTLDSVRRLIDVKIDPGQILRHPLRGFRIAKSALRMRPRKTRRGPVLAHSTSIDQLPRQQSWPDDGGSFITLGQVYSENIETPGWRKSNLGMYRVQLSGGQYKTNNEVGLHYQIHRGIGVHHSAAIRQGKPFRVNVFVGGSPAMTLAAVMPLPEGMSELMFAGALAGRRIPMIAGNSSLPIYGHADFCICGTVYPDKTLPEGPFGDHLGYYSLVHDFPVLRVEKVLHRKDAIWPFTVVGRPPQEDTIFGKLIHELSGPVIPSVIPGVHAVHAVDAAGVHPLMLAIGSERYVPYEEQTQPQELLTQANAILGHGQLSLAKYLLIVNRDDDPNLDVNDESAFFHHLLRRIDWRRDLHFQTRTTIDTLDYSGSGLNEGSKVVMAAVGPPQRSLPEEIPEDLELPTDFDEPRVCLPGTLAVRGPAFASYVGSGGGHAIQRFCSAFRDRDSINQFPLIVVVDDSEFAAQSLRKFLWVVFTRSNPASDIYGIGEFTDQKHWGCLGSLVIDARIKPHHAPPLVEDPEVSKKVDALAARGSAISKYL